jgi:hypothetical protein
MPPQQLLIGEILCVPPFQKKVASKPATALG